MKTSGCSSCLLFCGPFFLPLSSLLHVLSSFFLFLLHFPCFEASVISAFLFLFGRLVMAARSRPAVGRPAAGAGGGSRAVPSPSAVAAGGTGTASSSSSSITSPPSTVAQATATVPVPRFAAASVAASASDGGGDELDD